MKKFLLGIAVFMIMAVLCVVSAGAEYEYTVLDDGTVEITDYVYTYTSNNIEIPSEIDGKKVTSIGYGAFYDCDFLISVTIPDSVTSIGDYAFNYCKSLKSITIPDSVTSIGEGAFSNCHSFKSITIPDSVTSIGINPFKRCINLTSITVDSANEYYTSVNGMLYNKSKTTLIACPTYKQSGIDTIPDSVTSIGDYAFCDCDRIYSITIPDGVTYIGNSAFESCNRLISITIPDNVTSIGDFTFCSCYSLRSITIPDSVTSIGDYAFYDCESLKSVTIPNSVTSIGDWAFSDCESLTSITLPDSVTSIGEEAFEDCYSLESITIPDSVTSIGDAAFYYCKSLSSVAIPNGVTSIGDVTFGYCESLESVAIGNSVTSIGDRTFSHCTSLTSITLPDSVTSIDDDAFYNCKSLLFVTIGDGVTSIGESAFRDCESLESITIRDNVTSIGDETFNNCSPLLSETISNSATSIGDYAFYNCYALKSVNVPDNVTSIGDEAFYNCYRLSSITIPDSVTSIGDYAFYECHNLVIYCYEDSYAHEYAKKYHRFKIILSPVKNLAVKSRNYNSITLSWDENAYASGYIIEQYKNDEWVNIAEISDISITEYKITNLAANTSYNFRVVGYATKDGATEYSYTRALTVSTAPAQTQGFAITGRGSDYLTITWTKNAGASGYIIQEQVNGVWKNVASIKGNATTSYTIANLQPNSFHRYRMVAYKTDANGTCYGKYTGSAPGYTAPAMVSNFKVSDIGADSLTISWDKVESADGYVIDIYRDGKWSQLAKITSNATTSYKASGLIPGTTYKFRIKSYATNGTLTINSTYSSAISGIPVLAKVENLRMTNRGTDFISVRWDKNSDADGYMVYIHDGTKWTCVKTLTSNSAVSHKITGLTSGKAYKITVKAYKTVNGTKYISDTVTISANTL